MNKLLKAFCIGLGIITHQLHSISLTDYIQQHGMPEVTYYYNLNLSNKNLTDLTGLQEIPHIDQVRTIFLSHNQLQTLPSNTFNGLHNLEELYLHSNQIQTLPSDIFSNLTKLRSLNLNNNQIQTLPDAIFNGLHNLGILNLSNNQIKTLPDTIFNGLHTLGILTLDNNQLKTLPSNIFNYLYNLQVIKFGNNQLQKLSDTIFNDLKILKVLDFQGNSFTSDFIPALKGLLLNLPNLSQINGIPKSEAMQKEPFVTLRKLVAANIARNINKYRPSLHTLPEDILDLLPLTEQQRKEIEEQREKLEKEREEIERR